MKSELFTQPRADAAVIPCMTFGGGWIIPLTPHGFEILLAFYDEEPTGLAPLGMLTGYVVEPEDAETLANHLKHHDCTWRLGL